jgi:hypothetical protein
LQFLQNGEKAEEGEEQARMSLRRPSPAPVQVVLAKWFELLV